jgi:hypothetical protein
MSTFQELQKRFPSKVVDGHGRLVIYAELFVVINGYVQAEATSVDVRLGPDKYRVFVRSAVPEHGFEWDGRPYLGTEETARVNVFGPGSESIIHRDMKVTWFAVSHGVNREAMVRMVFECDRNKAMTPDASPEKKDVFGYERQ